MRYQRMADDLKIPTAVLQANLVAPGSNNLDYILTSMPAADAVRPGSARCRRTCR